MLAADTTLEVGTYGAALFYGHLDELTYTILVENLEGVNLQNLLLEINGEEAGDVIAAVAEGHLREVVRAEAEVLGARSDAVGREGCTRNLNHRTYLEGDFHTFLCEEGSCFIADYLFLSLKLIQDTREGHHDFGMGVKAFALEFKSSAKDGTGLHLRDARISVTEAATTVTEHRVVLAEVFYALADVLYGYAHGLCHFFLSLGVVGYELVKRRIEQTDVDGMAVHGAEDTLEVFLLDGKEFGEGLLATFYVFGKNHFAHGNNLVVVKEHVLRTAEADTYSTEATSYFCIVRRISIGANTEFGMLLAEVHQGCEVSREFSSLRADSTLIYTTIGTIQGDVVAFVKNDTINLNRLGLVVHIDGTSTADAAF